MLDDYKDFASVEELEAEQERKLFSLWLRDAAAVVLAAAVFMVAAWFLPLLIAVK